MPAVTLSNRFNITVPKEVRESQGWKPGQRLAFIPRGSGYELVPVPKLGDLRGIAKGADTTSYRDQSDRD
jgi:AbrB family looped-hinge helix DNA binding protein